MRTILSILGLTLLLSSVSCAQESYSQKRAIMVRKQIEKRGITDQRVLEAMSRVPRHRFVPAEWREQAYEDRPLPIGYGQTISQPYIVAYMTSAIEPEPHFKVLEIGTGCGYQAAVLAELVQEVYTIEIVRGLGESAAVRLKELGYENVEVKVGDGYAGWPEHAPFDAIIVTAAPEQIPPPLIAQLREGGKMIIPVGHSFPYQTLKLVEKVNGKAKVRNLLAVRFVPFTRE